MPSQLTVSALGHHGLVGEIQQSARGIAFFRGSLCVNHWNGPGEEPTAEWIGYTMFSEEAERWVASLQKGDLVLVEGQARTEEYQGRDGQPRHELRITCHRYTAVNFSAWLRAKEVTGSPSTRDYDREQRQRQEARRNESQRMPETADVEDEIPF